MIAISERNEYAASGFSEKAEITPCHEPPVVLPTRCGLSVSTQVPFSWSQYLSEAGQDRRAADALELGARLILAERADIAPAEHEDRLAAQEVVPRLAQAPAHLRSGARLVQLLQELERRDVAGAVDQRGHVGGIEPVDVVVLGHLRAGRHGEGRGERLEVIVPLLAHLEVQHGTAIGLVVVGIPVLAVEELRDVEKLPATSAGGTGMS